MNYVIVSDVESRISELRKIEKKFPNHIIISNGDLIDRNSDAKETLDFFLNSNHIAIMGNHELMMIDFLENTNLYFYDDWLRNGGIDTVGSFILDNKQKFIFENLANILIKNCNSYDLKLKPYHTEKEALLKEPNMDSLRLEIIKDTHALRKIALDYIPQKYINFIKNLNWFFETTDLFVSHCPIPESMSIENFKKECNNKNIRIFQNRFVSLFPKEKLMIFGHNAQQEPKKYFYKQKMYAINIDSSRNTKVYFYNSENKSLGCIK